MPRAATPLILAALGELVTEKSGVLNLGVERIILVGAVAGFITDSVTGNMFIGKRSPFLYRYKILSGDRNI
ncbi:hypothetical protein [Nostoc sp.]|uniref:hypothetical protein n=1 Tax=Nostoc sp. TaxID=1180 RepID=UPI002FF90AEE